MGSESSAGRIAILLILVWLGVGCPDSQHEITSDRTYIPPLDTVVSGSAEFEMDLDEAWARLVSEIDRPPFSIVAAQESARFMVVELDSRASDYPPSEFVDCGRIKRRIVEDGKPTIFEYDFAAAATDREVAAGVDSFEIREVQRRPLLAIRSTLFLQPKGPMRTRVTINARYALTIELSGEMRRLPRRRSDDATPRQPFGPERTEIPFTSFQAGVHPGDESIRCRATGALEGWLLSLGTKEPGSL